MAASAACGVRSVEVPVDAGPAPSRASCTPPAAEDGTEVYLVCGSRVEPVARSIELPGMQSSAAGSGQEEPEDTPRAEREGARDRVALAAALLSELQSDPEHEEQAAGFTSTVPADLRVSGPAGDDPDRLLRLSSRPDDLPAFALVQIICTFAHTQPVGDGHSVLLAGPAETAADQDARGYTCGATLRNRPDTARTAAESP
ncbi:hypothetical protein PJ985_05635 [Streptomyces sp. ACA25]|uniref:hypothetical protein n=1 Tax=Streptomyces sp. ACA25 TaxID=3022596 RepID=UPI0023074DAD|nr:hypothetical protein [Streptomyces sp. ACA25]MDB1087047.1 hypothetical protein [Streptomyces sp. ACA25]